MNQDPARHAAVAKDPLRDALHLLNSTLRLSEPHKLSEPQIMIILDALAGSRDPALVSRFAAVLAICGRHGIELSSPSLLGRYWESSPKRQNLEKLLIVSADLLRRENIAAPRNLEQIAESLKTRHAGLGGADYVQMADGPGVSVAEMRAALKQFAGDAPPQPAEPAAEPRNGGSIHLGAQLALLFSEKQQELVLKKLKGQHLTKTEREYFSRVVKKKLAAIAAPEIQELALALTRGGRREFEGQPPD